MPQVCGKNVGSTGFGLMGFTWRPEPCPTSQAIQVMRTALSRGINYWDAGELYGTAEYNSMHLLKEYFTQYPNDADKIVLNVKGCVNMATFTPDGSEEGIRRSIENCNKILGGKKLIDSFECARVDPKVPIEDTMRAFKKVIDEGLIGGVSLSEVSADTIRRAAKIAKIDTVEVEFSLYSTDILTNGIAEACAEHGIPLIAYSPLGRGFLTGRMRKPEDVPKELLHMHPRFAPENFDNNYKLFEEVELVAKRKGCTPSQVAIAWIKTFDGAKGMPTIMPIPGATTESRLVENTTDVTLSPEDMKEINDALKKCVVIGGRYGGPSAAFMDG